MRNKLPQYLYGSWLLSLTLLLTMSTSSFAQSQMMTEKQIEAERTRQQVSSPAGVITGQTSNRSMAFPAAYYNSSWTVFAERIDGAGEATVRSVDPNTFTIPNTSTSTAPRSTQATVVYDNGPHINQPGTPDLSVLESVTLDMNTLGANITNNLGYGVADDFELVAETEITSITAYAYQTGATSTTINGMYVTIWDGDPSDGASSVIWGNNTTNVFGSVENSGAYRVSETDLGGRTRILQKVNANISGLTLNAGTYWLAYSLAGTSTSGPWQPAIVILGEDTTGDALQLTSDGWQPWMDTGSNTPQGVPFQIEGIASGGGGTAGEDCNAPIVVTTLPYDDAGNTATYGNFYTIADVPPIASDAVTTGTGSEYYLSGDEVVYSYTPDEDEVLNISTTNDNDWIGLWAFTGCPFTSTVGYHTSISGDTRLIEELPVTAGETYYFVISTWSPPESTEYTIHIEKVGGSGSDSSYACEQDFEFSLEDGVGDLRGLLFAEDFEIDAGTTMSVEKVTYRIFNNIGQATTIAFYEDDGGTPGTLVQSFSNVAANSQTLIGDNYGMDAYDVEFNLPSAVELEAGIFWVALQVTEGTDGGANYWVITDDGVHAPAHFTNDGGVTWTANTYDDDLSFKVEGECTSDGGGGGDGFVCTDQFNVSNAIENGTFFGGTTNQKMAVDIVVGDAGFTVYGSNLNVFLDAGQAPGDLTFDFIFYDNDAGLPGDEVHTSSAVVMGSDFIGANFGFDIYTFEVAFDDAVDLDANTTYWMEVESNGVAWETTSVGVFESNLAFLNDNTGGDWTINSTGDAVYSLICEEGTTGGSCDPVNVPYVQDFETAITPDMPECTTVVNAGNGNNWKTSTDEIGDFTGTFLSYEYHASSADSWFFTQGINLVAGTQYEITYGYGSRAAAAFPENLGVAFGEDNDPASMTNMLAEHTAILSGGSKIMNTVEFTVASSGVHYFGFNAFSGADMWYLYVDDIEIKEVGGTVDDCGQGDESNGFENAFNITEGVTFRNADDFFVSADNTLNIRSIELNIFANAPVDSININFFEDDGGAPGSTIAESVTGLIPYAQVPIGANFGYTVYAVFVEVDLNFEGGSSGAAYWMQPEAVSPTAFWEVTSLGTLGEPIHTSDTMGPWVADEDGSHAVFTLHCDVATAPDPQCLFDITASIEPITRVLMAGIDNTSSPVVNGSPALEDFTNIEGAMSQNATYDVAFEGNSDGPYTNYFTVWIDWDQDGEWDSSEMYEIGSITGSTGTDGMQATGTITVPADAALGATTMRVIKSYNTSPTDPCGQYSFGQGEDYTIIVDDELGIDDQSSTNFSYYPNPTNGVVNITANKNISSLTVLNILGQQVLEMDSLDEGQVDISTLSTGTYMFRVMFEDGSMEIFKVLKE